MSTRLHTDGREPYTRRQFVTLLGLTAAAVAAGGVGSCAARKPPPPALNAIWRQTPAGYERVRMFELRAGDLFRIEGQERLQRAESDPERDADGRWSILTVSPSSASDFPLPPA